MGAIFGIATAITINFWEQLTGTRPIVSFLWAMPASFLAEVGLASLVSLLPIGRSVPFPSKAMRVTLWPVVGEKRSYVCRPSRSLDV